MSSTKKIVRLLREEYPGSEISYTGKGHIKLHLPNGRYVTVAATPSNEKFFLRNVRGDVNRKLKGQS